MPHYIRSSDSSSSADFLEKAGNILYSPYRKFFGGYRKVEVLKDNTFSAPHSVKKTSNAGRAAIAVLGSVLIIPLFVTLVGKLFLHLSSTLKKINQVWLNKNKTPPSSNKPKKNSSPPSLSNRTSNTNKVSNKTQNKAKPKPKPEDQKLQVLGEDPIVLKDIPEDPNDPLYQNLTNINFKAICDQLGHDHELVLRLYNGLLAHYNVPGSLLEALKESKLPDMQQRVKDFLYRVNNKPSDFGPRMIGEMTKTEFFDTFVAWLSKGWVTEYRIFNRAIDKLKNNEPSLDKIFNKLKSADKPDWDKLRYMLANTESESFLKTAFDRFNSTERELLLAPQGSTGLKAAEKVVRLLDMKNDKDKALLEKILETHKEYGPEKLQANLSDTQRKAVQKLLDPVAVAVGDLYDNISEDDFKGKKLLQVVSNISTKDWNQFFRLLDGKDNSAACYKKLIKACVDPKNNEKHYAILKEILEIRQNGFSAGRGIEHFTGEQLKTTLSKIDSCDDLIEDILYKLNEKQLTAMLQNATLKAKIIAILNTFNTYLEHGDNTSQYALKTFIIPSRIKVLNRFTDALKDKEDSDLIVPYLFALFVTDQNKQGFASKFQSSDEETKNAVIEKLRAYMGKHPVKRAQVSNFIYSLSNQTVMEKISKVLFPEDWQVNSDSKSDDRL